MPRALQIAVLRSAARLVPASERREWLAEWTAELSYVKRDATRFCLGSFRDALWLRADSLNARRNFVLESPLACLLFLSGTGALLFGLSQVSRMLGLPSQPMPSGRELALEVPWMYLLSLLVLATLNPLALGEYPANRFAPCLLIRLRRWLFLAAKVAILAPIVCLASFAPSAVFPAAVWTLFFCWILALRWALMDQRQRCPVCLCLLSEPIQTGSPSHLLFEPYGAERSCSRGHGQLYIPEFPTTWCAIQRWRYGKPSANG